MKKLCEAGGMSNIEKVDLWHEGKISLNLEDYYEEELADFWRLASIRGYDDIKAAIDAECDRRGIPHFNFWTIMSMPTPVPSAEDIELAEDITDKIFKILIKSVEYVLNSDIHDLLEDEYESSYREGDWPGEGYMNIKRYGWKFDWEDYYIDDVDGDHTNEIEAKIIEKYKDKILPVIDLAKAAIIEKYKSKAPHVVPLVEMILDTVYVSIGNDCNFDFEEGNFGGGVSLELAAVLLD